MELLDLKYSLFGDFSELIRKWSEVTRQNFPKKFDISLGNQIISTPLMQVPDVIISLTDKENKTKILLTRQRIDFCFPKKSEDNLKLLFEYINLFYIPYLDSKINRIAINYSFFEKDENQEKLNKILNKYNLININKEGILKELNLRFNKIIVIDGISLNFINSINNAKLQDKNTFVTSDVIVRSIDINTEIKQQLNYTDIFNFKCLNSIFSKMDFKCFNIIKGLDNEF